MTRKNVVACVLLVAGGGLVAAGVHFRNIRELVQIDPKTGHLKGAVSQGLAGGVAGY